MYRFKVIYQHTVLNTAQIVELNVISEVLGVGFYRVGRRLHIIYQIHDLFVVQRLIVNIL